MKSIQTSGVRPAAGRVAWRVPRIRAMIALALLATLGMGLFWYFEATKQQTVPDNKTYMPITDPPPDPNRPDLFGEPRSLG